MRIPRSLPALVLPAVLLALVAIHPAERPGPSALPPPAAETEAVPPGVAAEVAGLIEQLAEVGRTTDEYPYQGFPFETRRSRLYVPVPVRPGPSLVGVQRRIVRHGAAAIPVLVAHLDDRRTTGIYIAGGEGIFPGYHDAIDHNPRTSPARPGRDAQANRNPFPQRGQSEHLITVGDLCFDCLGRIVNRTFCPVTSHGGINCLTTYTVTSPTHTLAVLTAAREDWGATTRARHRDSLVADYMRPDSRGRWEGACQRLAYYYPETLEALVLRDLDPAADPNRLAEFIERGLCYDHSPRIDRAVRDLLLGTGSDRLALACMARLVGRGYDADIERECRRRCDNAKGVVLPVHAAYLAMLDKVGWTPVHAAVERADHENLAALLRSGAAPDTPDRRGRVPLDLAAEEGEDEMVRLLVAHGAAVKTLPVAVIVGDHKAARAILKATPAARDARLKSGPTPLFRAVAQGDASMARLLLDAGAWPDGSDERWNSPLDEAIRSGDVTLAKLLLERQASLVPEPIPAFLLWLAVRQGRPEMVRLVLEFHPDVDEVFREGDETPLACAVAAGNRAVARLLLEAGAKVDVASASGWTPLHRAVERSDAEVARWLLDRKASLATRASMYQDDLDLGLQAQPLHLAAMRGNEELVQLLLERGAEPDTLCTEAGLTPLYLAACRGAADVARLLLQRGAKVNRRDFEGRTPLHYAVTTGQPGLVRLLLEHGAEAEAADEKGATPLLLAVEQKNAATARVLLAHGAAVDGTDATGRTPLLQAAHANDLALARLLLEHKANVRAVARRAEDFEPLHIAAGHKDGVALVALLLDHGAAIDAKERYLGQEHPDGRTALHVAVEENNAAVAEVLLARGARWDIEDRVGRTALDRVRQQNDPAVRTAFRKHGALKE